MLKIKQSLFFNEKVFWCDDFRQFIVKKRKLNAPHKVGLGGRVPKGKDKYKLIIHKQVLVEYADGSIRKETRALNWKTMSAYIRDRDGRCLKCGKNKGRLDADHFHPACYQWINWFFRTSKIQTLCKSCHDSMPKMNRGRMENWRDYVYLR